MGMISFSLETFFVELLGQIPQTRDLKNNLMLNSKMYVCIIYRIDLYLIFYLLNVRRIPIDLITNGNNNKSTMMMVKIFK